MREVKITPREKQAAAQAWKTCTRKGLENTALGREIAAMAVDPDAWCRDIIDSGNGVDRMVAATGHDDGKVLGYLGAGSSMMLYIMGHVIDMRDPEPRRRIFLADKRSAAMIAARRKIDA